MANALKDLPYSDFLRFAQTPEGKNISLDTGAALGLCRGGTVPTKAPLAWLGLFWLSLLSIPCIFFATSPRFIIVSIFLAWLGARRSKRAAIAAVWRETRGDGALNAEQREGLYELLVRHDWLYMPSACPPVSGGYPSLGTYRNVRATIPTEKTIPR